MISIINKLNKENSWIKHIAIICSLIFLLELLFYVIVKNNSASLSLLFSLIIDVVLFVLYRKRKNEIYLFILLISLIASIYYLPYFVNSNIFCFDNDHYTEYENFYKEWKRLLDGFMSNGSFPFYSFNSFLGNDFFSSKSFHVTGDLLFFIFYIFPTINEGIVFQSYILTIISAVFMTLFLKEFGIQKKSVVYCGAFLYAVGALAIYYTSPIAWKRFYCFLPLLFFGIERYRAKNKMVWFSIATSILFLSNYYNMFPTTLFLPAYFIFTYSYHNNVFNFKLILKESFKLMLSYVVGFLLAGIIIIPTLYFMINNPRVGSGMSKALFFDFRVYIGYLYSMIVHQVVTIKEFRFNMSDNGHLSIYSCYISSVVIPCVFSFLLSKRTDKKNFYIKIFIVYLFVVSLNPIVNSIMHGFSQASLRPLFLTAFIFLLLFCVFFDREDLDYRLFKRGLVLLTIVFVVFTLIGIVLGILPVSIENQTLLYAMFAIAINYLYLYIIKKQGFRIVFIISCSIAVLVNIYCLRVSNEEYDFYSDSLDRDVLKYIQDIDEDKFYRININDYTISPYTELNLNQSLNYGYRGTSAYDSTYEGNLQDFLEMNGITDTHIIRITNPECLRMLGVKYFYVQDESELPNIYNYELVTNNNNYLVYRINEYRPIAFTYSVFTINKDYITKENLWNDVLYVEEELYKDIEDIQYSDSIDFMITDYYSDNNIKGEIETVNKQVLFFSIPYNDGWKIKDNGEYVETHKVQGGFLGVVLNPGYHKIELIFTPVGFKYGFLASSIGFACLAIIVILEHKKIAILRK